MSDPVDPPKRTIHSVEAAVAANRDLGAEHRLLRLVAPEAASCARAGQFLMVGLPGTDDPLLPRPFAFFDIDRDAGEVAVLFKVVGRGTRLLAELPAGEKLRLTGPLGRGWRRPEGAKEGTSVLVAGGTAWAALHLLAKELAADGREVCAIWGGPSEESFPDREAVSPPEVSLRLSTDDGSCGFSGTALDCLCEFVGKAAGDRKPVLYGAGPLPMLAKLAAFARDGELACQVSLEARMACGIGVCRGCVVNAREVHPETGLHRRAVCTDGPVFDARELDWENLR
ncbi:MAG: dihydroorotate dehydrogenase electron transfer subunit [Planctomycetota bacterium]|jgi:dihydroorotate dehydrogenase electron transfer subunit